MTGSMVTVDGGSGWVADAWAVVVVGNDFRSYSLSVKQALMLGLIGVLTGLWADKFDHMAFITNFIITPLAFLSGTFYSIHRLPEFAQAIAQVNPFFYAIDGFRHALVGQGDIPLWTGAAVLSACNVALATWAFHLIRRGYNLKD